MKILLVDDEPIITRGLTKLINWEEAGFRIIGTADNAQDAAKIVELDRPDVIITDLQMPDISGMNFIKSISASGLNIKVVVLSGYSEFEYAREAFGYGIMEYLLKPVTRQKLLEVLKNVSDAISRERAFNDRITLLKAQLNESMPLLKQKFLLDVLRGDITEEDNILKKAEFLDMNLSGSGYVALALSIDNIGSNELFPQKKDIVLLKFAAENIATEIIGARYKSYPAESGDTLFLLLVLDRDDLPVKDIFDAASEIKESLHEHLKALASIGISRVYSKLKFAVKAFNEANYALKLGYSQGYGSIVHINSFMLQQESRNEYPLDSEKKVIEGVIFDASVNPAELASLLVKSFVEASGGKAEILYGFCQEFLVQLRRSLRGFNANPDSILPYNGAAELKSLCNSVPQLFDWLKEVIVKVARCVAEKRKAREYDVVQEAKTYIDSNFSEDLSLGRVANRVYMSPTYFSALFKSKTGENFSEYLTRVRMEAAARQLCDNTFKTYEIAEAFGYKNPRYFSEAFKKYYGLTPSEYREKFYK